MSSYSLKGKGQMKGSSVLQTVQMVKYVTNQQNTTIFLSDELVYIESDITSNVLYSIG